MSNRSAGKSWQSIPNMPRLGTCWASCTRSLATSRPRQTAFACAIALDANAAAFHCNLGNVHGALHTPREAIACYRRALELRPDLVVAHNNLANALLEQRQPEQAIASYRRALELNPNYFDACINLGNALKDQENSMTRSPVTAAHSS